MPQYATNILTISQHDLVGVGNYRSFQNDHNPAILSHVGKCLYINSIISSKGGYVCDSGYACAE